MTNQQRNSILAKYSREKLSPTPEQRTRISTRYKELMEFLEGDCFMSGSYARFTAVRPPKDLDVIWICADSRLTQEPWKFLNALKTWLSEKYRLSAELVSIETQEHSLKITFEMDADGFSIDVVPAFPIERMNGFGDPILCVPEIQKLSDSLRQSFSGKAAWILSDPKGYIRDATNLDNETRGVFRKAAKIVKAWRQKHKSVLGDDFKLKSFHLEQLVYRHLSENPRDSILQTLRAVLTNLQAAIVAPAIPDRADPNTFIDEYVAELTCEERATILELQMEANRIIMRLEGAESESEITLVLDSLTQSTHRNPAALAPAVVIATPPQPYGWTE